MHLSVYMKALDYKLIIMLLLNNEENKTSRSKQALVWKHTMCPFPSDEFFCMHAMAEEEAYGDRQHSLRTLCLSELWEREFN